MRIVVNHLTRMQPGYICVAGLDPDTGRHVRPCLPQGRLSARCLARYHGPFDVAVLVDLGPTTPRSSPPETEDELFDPRQTRRVRVLSAAEYWALLQSVSATKLTELFGNALTRPGRGGCAVAPGQGIASVGCLLPAERPGLLVIEQAGRRPRLRLEIGDGQYSLNLSVTDIRLYGADHTTPDRGVVDRIRARLQSGERVIVSVGLSRPFAARLEEPELHWLQVNGIHLESDPVWQLG
jgi:hypothetical protein